MPRDYRNIAYRPAREISKVETGAWNLYRRFYREYIAEYFNTLFFCILLVSVNASSMYLMAYISKTVVDEVLVVEAVQKTATHSVSELELNSVFQEGRFRRPHRLPDRGAFSELQQAESSTRRPPHALQNLMGLSVLFVSLLVALNYAVRVAQRFHIRISQEVTRRLREDMHRKILSLSRSYHQRHTPGRLMARILSDVEMVNRQLIPLIMESTSQLISFFIGAALLLIFDWRLAVFALFAMVPYVFIYRTAFRAVRPIAREVRHTNACLYGLVSTKLDAVKAIYAYGREAHERLNFFQLALCFFRDTLKQQRVSASLSRAAMLLTALTTVTIFLFSTRFTLRGELSVGEMMYVYAITSMLFGPVLNLTTMSVSLSNMLVVLQRIVQVLDEPVEIR
ncbi:MAG: ABC transporter ATP-binding protein, partial [Bacteroidetes bacterium]|nr:ABC transporter ATP-binding protein [Bacteroidota bacterium]